LKDTLNIKSKLIQNKKGDLPSFIFTIIIIFTLGIFLLIFTHLSSTIYSALSSRLDSIDNGAFNNSVSDVALDKAIAVNNSIWDYFFLAIVVGYVFSLLFFSFSTPSNPIFFWIYVLVLMLGLFVGVALSNTWEAMSDNPTFATTITRFPITDALLDNFFPVFITVIGVTMTIMLFGKFAFGGNG